MFLMKLAHLKGYAADSFKDDETKKELSQVRFMIIILVTVFIIHI